MSNGQTFENGTTLHSVGHAWHERLTVIRRDSQSYGVDRYVVADRHGRRGYAY